ncbi:ergosterol biosynthesis ERG4/ERG24 [Entophlyctis helioformis]|nr:ergosterol biosynthesis ERG4/ERG24 [Entophlyctis helioformis]
MAGPTSTVRARPTAAKQAADAADVPAKGDARKAASNWGRSWDIGILTVVGCYFLLAFCPVLVTFFWLSCTSFQCSIVAPVEYVLANDFQALVANHFPKPTLFGFQLYFGWLLFQAVLYTFLPGKIGYGQTTPAGHTLPYVVNGLLAWIVTHALFIAGAFYFNLFDGSIIADNWGALLIAANCYGYFLTFFSYAKAYIFPSHPEDRKISNSFVYNLFMGIEFNPRFGKYFDFKLFHNGRPGIVAWTLINLSFAAAQYKQIGYVTNSMALLNFLHIVYVLDFFYNEDWYLRTIDIAHDHFGFYLAWGDTVWLPYMYTLQSHFLLRNTINLTWAEFSIVFAIGMIGYYIFRTVNNQKDLVRSTDGKCLIWGKPARVIRTEFTTTNGDVHRSLLLTSGYWGVSRHFNYVGDLLMSLAMCLTCGVGYILPYFYIVYMTILLVQRIERDHLRCKGKYGKYWDMYCTQVPYKLIPYVF